MLHFGGKPPFPFAEFIRRCYEFIPQSEAAILEEIPVLARGFYEGKQPILKRWQEFETALRNELVKIRSSHRHIDPARFLRPTDFSDLYLSHLVMTSFRNPSILETEKTLDEARWRFLEELSLGHYFDLDALIVYSLKLLLLERWQKINSADKTKVLEETLSSI